MQEKFTDLKKYAQDTSKKIIAKIREKQDEDTNIESYDGDDAYYTGSDEDYEEFLKSVEGETEEEAVPVENTQRVSLGDTINLQGVIDKFKEKAGELTSAAKKFKEDISSQIEDFKAAATEKTETTTGEAGSEPNEPELTKSEPAKQPGSEAGDDKTVSQSVHVNDERQQIRTIDIAEFREGMTAVAEGLSAVDKKLDTVGVKASELSDKLQAIELRVIDSGKETEQSVSDLKQAVNGIEQSIDEIKQASSGISKINDSIFDVKNAQVNAKNALAELEMSFIRLKKKCIVGITILSILSAIVIGLQIVQLLS